MDFAYKKFLRVFRKHPPIAECHTHDSAASSAFSIWGVAAQGLCSMAYFIISFKTYSANNY